MFMGSFDLQERTRIRAMNRLARVTARQRLGVRQPSKTSRKLDRFMESNHDAPDRNAALAALSWSGVPSSNT